MSTLEGRACTCGLISTSPPWVARPVMQPVGLEGGVGAVRILVFCEFKGNETHTQEWLWRTGSAY